MKNTGINKVLGRKDYRIIMVINKSAKTSFQEVVMVRDYTK